MVKRHGFQNAKEHKKYKFELKIMAHQRYIISKEKFSKTLVSFEKSGLWIAVTSLILVAFRKMNRTW